MSSSGTIGKRPSSEGVIECRPGSLTGCRVAVVIYSEISGDPRPLRAALALVQTGAQVDVICLAGEGTQPGLEERGKLTILRIEGQPERKGKVRYAWQYARFLLRATCLLSYWSLRRSYQLVHVHNMPDFLVFAAAIPKWKGAKVILDLHDPTPELYQTIFECPPESPMIRLLTCLERMSVAFANLVLTPNIAFRDLFVSRGCPPDKIQIIMNAPDEAIFDPGLKSQVGGSSSPAGDEFRVMFHGSLLQRHGLDTAVEALRLLADSAEGVRLYVYGPRTSHWDEIVSTVKQQGLESQVAYRGLKAISQIPAEILKCHIGLIPNHRSCFTEINFPTRIFEYLALHKPVIVPRTRGILDYFGPQDLIYFDAGDASDLARVIRWVRDHPAEVAEIVERGRAVYLRHQWHLERDRFLYHVRGLLGFPPEEQSVRQPPRAVASV